MPREAVLQPALHRGEGRPPLLPSPTTLLPFSSCNLPYFNSRHNTLYFGENFMKIGPELKKVTNIWMSILCLYFHAEVPYPAPLSPQILYCASGGLSVIVAFPEYIHLSQRMTTPTKWHVGPVKTQISLGIRPVWSESAVRMKKVWVLSYYWAHSKDWSDWAYTQTDLSLCWAHKPFYCCFFFHALAHLYF